MEQENNYNNGPENYKEIIIDEQMKLIQLRPDQADKIFTLTDDNREYLGEFLPWVDFVKTVDDSRKHIEQTIENRNSGKAFSYGIEYDGEIVGDISIRNLNSQERPPEIGYWIDPKFSGKGLTTRAVKKLTDLALNSLNVSEVIIRAAPANIASNKIAEKSGYIEIGTEVENDETLVVWRVTK